jgi:DegV family protein with EDD domain
MAGVLDRIRQEGLELSTRLLSRLEGRTGPRRVGVVTDSTADIPPALAEKLEITVVPCNVIFGERTYREGIDISRGDFYRRMAEEEELPTTSQPSVEQFRQVYRELGQRYGQIVSIHLSSSLSGTLNSAQLAARDLPELEIAVVDSRQASIALGWLAIYAARAAEEGQLLEQIRALVKDMIPRIRVLAMLDTLEYVQRLGRIGKAAALMGTLLNIKPIIQVKDGEVLPLERVRSQRKALNRMVEMVRGMGPLQEVSVLHANAPSLAERLREMLAPLHPEGEMIVTEASTVVGAHTGPGAVGVVCVLADQVESHPQMEEAAPRAHQ